MAITWGAAIADATNAFRIGYEFSQSPATVVNGTASVVVTESIYLGTKYWAYDSSVSWTISGSITASGTASFNHQSSTAWSPSNVTLLATRSRTVTTSYTSTVATTLTATVTGLTAIAGTASVSGTWTTAKRPVAAPAAPTSLVASRVSDAQINISWVNTSPANVAAPYANIVVERRDNRTSTWVKVATLGVVSSYSDKSTVANRRYEYRVKATNAAGSSGYSGSDLVSTTPAAPVMGGAVKDSAGNILVQVASYPDATVGVTQELWHAADGVWDAAPLATSTQHPLLWTHLSPSLTQTHAYRLTATSSDPVLRSAYSATSNTVALTAPPAAPSSLAPDGEPRDATQAIPLRWLHVPVDTTAQTAFEVQYRVSGGAWVSSGKVASTSSTWTLPAGTVANPGQLEWQVRTWGAAAAAGPWSATAIVVLSSTPTVTISTPTDGGQVATSRLSVSWGYHDQENAPQLAWRVVLRDDSGGVAESASGAGDASSVTLSAILVDGATYSVEVTVMDGAGLSSVPDAATFTVAYALPPAPALSLSWVARDGVVVADITNVPAGPGQVEAVSNVLQRSLDGASWAVVAEDIPANGAAVDQIPRIGGISWYRVVALSDLPSAASSAPVMVDCSVGADSVWINAGPGFTRAIRLISNVVVSMAPSRAKVRHAFDGRSYGTEFAGEELANKLTVQTDLFAAHVPGAERIGASTWQDIWEFCLLPGPACYRDPDGTRLFVTVGEPSISGLGSPRKRSVSIPLEQVDWTEPTGVTGG